MRFCILKDKKISTKELDVLTTEFTSLIKSTTGITPDFYVHEEDYSTVPTEADSDGDLKPTKAYTTALMEKVHSIYGRWGIDSVVILVHRDNWKFAGIWGTNWSNLYYQYHVHLCRFDHKNVANSLGTLYHEWMHSLDALVNTHIGIEVDDYFRSSPCFVDWDSTCVHGNRYVGCKETPFKYIKWKDNTDALKRIAPHLKRAYARRKEMYLEPYRKVQLQVIDYLRGLLNKKDGVPRN